MKVGEFAVQRLPPGGDRRIMATLATASAA